MGRFLLWLTIGVLRRLLGIALGLVILTLLGRGRAARRAHLVLSLLRRVVRL